MNNLYILSETYTNGYYTIILDLIYLIAILSGIFVIISKNPIVSVLFLIGLFLSISSYLMLIGINFIGISYILVYVGAISILFLFILMLINIRISELISQTNNSIPLAILSIISFSFPVSQVLPYNSYNININTFTEIISFFNIKNLFFSLEDNAFIYYATSKTWDGTIAEATHISTIGNVMYTNYSMWIIITSIILLLAMVGAIIITIKEKD